MFEEEDTQGITEYHPINMENVTRVLLEGAKLSKILYILEVFLLSEFEHLVLTEKTLNHQP